MAAPALGLTFVLAGCGGGGNADPQQILSDALGGNGEAVTSGVLEVAVNVEATGDQDGTLRFDLSGPFDATDPDRLPSVDLDAKADVESSGGSFGFDGGLTVTADGAFVGFSGGEYELDAQTFARLQQSYEQAAAGRGKQDEGAGSLARFGLDPQSWVSDVSEAGTTDIDGEEYVHVEGEVDVPGMFSELNEVAARSGSAEDREAVRALGELERMIDSASIDVYASEGEHELRRVDLMVGIEDPRGGEVSLGLEIGLADPGSSQVITAPSNARPLSELLAQLPGGPEALGGLGINSGGLGLGGGSTSAGGGKAADRYYDCVAEATSDDEVAACADRLGN